MHCWCCLRSGNVLAAGGGIKGIDMKFAEPQKFGLGSVQVQRLLLFPWLVCACPVGPAARLRCSHAPAAGRKLDDGLASPGYPAASGTHSPIAFPVTPVKGSLGNLCGALHPFQCVDSSALLRLCWIL